MFWLFVKLAGATIRQDEKVAILKVLNRHAADYCEVLTEALDYDKISIDLLLDLVPVVLHDPQLALLDIPDALAASLAIQLREEADSALRNLRADSMHHCLYLDALCAVRANSKLVDKRFSNASRTLHSALLSLDPTYRDTWKSELTLQLKGEYIPLAVALALKSTHGRAALAECVDDLPALVQDPTSGLEVGVPLEAACGEDLNWYRHFTSDPDKYIQLSWSQRHDYLPISELVSFEEAVERMQKTDAERAAKKPQRSSRGDSAEADANNDTENAGRVHGGLENQGGAKRTENETTDPLRSLGAWVVAPLQRVRPFLARISGLRQVGGRNRPSSIALSDLDIDIERIAGASFALDLELFRRGGNPPAPARASEGVQDHSAGSAETERSEGDSHIAARRSDSEHDGVRGSHDEQAGAGEQASDDEKTREDEQALDDAQTQDDDQMGDEHGRGDERSQAGEVPHVQRSQTQDTKDGLGGREDAELGENTNALRTADVRREGEQGEDGGRGWGERNWDGERSHADKRGQTGGVSHVQAREAEEEVRAPKDGEHGGNTSALGTPVARREDEHDDDGEQDRDGERDQEGERGRDEEQDAEDARAHAEEGGLRQTLDKVKGVDAPEDAEIGGDLRS